MRHKVKGKILGRKTGVRNALRRNMINQFFEYERIKTTKAKSQAIRSEIEKLITIGKKGNVAVESDPARNVHLRRLAASKMDNPEMVKKLFDEIAPRFAERNGGYTRVVKLGWREGDKAEMVLLELVD